MKNITSKLTALEVGHAYAIGLDGVATILTELKMRMLRKRLKTVSQALFLLRMK